MALEPLLRRLKKDLSPEREVQARIARRLQSSISNDAFMRRVRDALEPTPAVRMSVWNRVLSSLTSRIVPSLLEFLKQLISPSIDVRSALKQQVMLRLQPAHATHLGYRRVKWVAAFVLVALVVRTSPMLFIASPTIADSSVILMPTIGDVSVSIAGLWQPVEGEFTLRPGMMLRTGESEASILFHDDAVVRLAPNTTIELHDTDKRFAPASELLPTLTLFTGELWVQGLIPATLRGLTVATTYGFVTVHDGSVSIVEDDLVDVRVWNRSVVVTRDGQDLALVAGERMELWEGNIPLVKKILAKDYDQKWVTQNLDRDAVHRREVAQLQQERRAARAGILPTSSFYPVKRVAEKIDVLLTLDEQTKVEKQLAQADTRLNEAASLLLDENDNEEASEALHEYQRTLLALATGSGDASLAQFLLRQKVSEQSAGIVAALPGDPSYLLKKTILETSAALPKGVGDMREAQGILLMDTLTSFSEQIADGDPIVAMQVWKDIQPYLALLEDDTANFKDIIRKEAHVILEQIATEVATLDASEVDPDTLEQIASYLPSSTVKQQVALTEEEIMEIVQKIRDRIFVYNMQQSRVNQYTYEVNALVNNPDRGRILRRLYTALPEGPENFPDRVRKELVKARWNQAAETL